MVAPAEQVSVILSRITAGDKEAADELLPLVYQQLRNLARARIARERPGQTLQATALVHEAYLRLVGDEDPGWSGKGHFYAAAAEAMRRILIEQARRKGRLRRGGDRHRITYADSQVADGAPAQALLDIDEALDRLEEHDEQMAMVVKLRFFAGLSIDDTAEMLEVSPRTVNRSWTAARAWLKHAVSDDASSGEQ